MSQSLIFKAVRLASVASTIISERASLPFRLRLLRVNGTLFPAREKLALTTGFLPCEIFPLMLSWLLTAIAPWLEKSRSAVIRMSVFPALKASKKVVVSETSN